MSVKQCLLDVCKITFISSISFAKLLKPLSVWSSWAIRTYTASNKGKEANYKWMKRQIITSAGTKQPHCAIIDRTPICRKNVLFPE